MPPTALLVQPTEQSSSPRAPFALTAVLAGCLLLVVGQVSSAAFVLTGAVLAGASALACWIGWAAALPAALTGLVLVATAAGTAGATLDLEVLDARRAVLAVHALIGATAILVVARRRRQRQPEKLALHLAQQSAALVALLIGLAQPLVPRLVPTWTMVSTDIPEHLVLLGQLQEHSSLSYEASGYPRGWHALLAFAAAPQAEGLRTEALLRQDLVLLAATVWLVLAVLLWTLAVLAGAYARRIGMSPRACAAATALAPWFLLGNASFQLTFLHLGATPSLIAVLTLWLLPVLAFAGTRRWTPTTVLCATAASMALLAHLWQPLILAPLSGGAAALLVLWRGERGRPVRLLRRLAPGTVAVVVGAALAAPAFVGVQRVGGVSLAAIPGFVPGAPVPVIALSVGALTAATWRLDRAARAVVVGTCVGLLGATAVLLIGADLELSAYYPQKALWFLCLAALPVVVGEGFRVIHRVIHWTDVRLRALSPRRHLRLGSRSIVGAGIAALLVPGLFGSTSVVRAAVDPESRGGQAERRISVAVTYATAFAPAVTVPVAAGLVGGNPGAYVTSKLMRFMTGQPTNYGLGDQVCDDVRSVAGTRPAVVVTDVSVPVLERLMVEDGCGETRVVQAPGLRTDDLVAHEEYIRSQAGQAEESPR